MAKRLVKIAKKLNVGTSTIVEFLRSNGYEIQNKPTSKVSDEMFDLLQANFIKSIEIKEEQIVKESTNNPNEIEVWSPIGFEGNWLTADTSNLEDILPSWYRKREETGDDDKDYEEFLSRLKRQHAIETGVVEKLYDLKEGITQTFIKEGFVESYLQHGDTNISPKKLMAYLQDHFDAIDFIFDLVKNNRPLTKSFIKELHHLLTQNQDTTDAIDSLGNIVQVPLLKGEFKKQPNNPQRLDGKLYMYCPPIHVESEMDKLISIYTDLVSKEINPIVISAWVHHAFTQIHPFQDGNGRVARLLASLILIKSELFPFTVKRDEKKNYISYLEEADKGNPINLVKLFSQQQKRSIEGILNWKSEAELNFSSLKDAAQVLSKKMDDWEEKKQAKRQNRIKKNRDAIFDFAFEIINVIKDELFEFIPYEKAKIGIKSVLPGDQIDYYFTRQIVQYAKMHHYFFNKNLPRGWFRYKFELKGGIEYDFVISIHHYSYDDAVMAIGGFLEFNESQKSKKEYNVEDSSFIPIKIEPYTISLEGDAQDLKKNIQAYIRDLITLAISNIASELT